MTTALSKKDGQILLKLAREKILMEFGGDDQKLFSLETSASPVILKENRGVFVSLHKKGELRGCIGNIEPVKTVWEGVMDNARHAAFHDSRFKPMSVDELKDTIIEVSILTPPEEVAYKDSDDLISKLKPGIDGVIIKKNYQSATFLPQVWEQLKSPDIFLRQLCMKAGFSPDEWESGNLIVSKYQVQVFEEEG